MGVYDCDNYNDLMARIDKVKNPNKAINSPTQMSGTSDAEFWKKRALEYSKTCCDLLARLSNGTKVDSIQLNENGISFHISTQPERKTGASNLISRCELFNRLATVKDLGEAFAVIHGMPTAEPERIYCRDCIHYRYADDTIPQEHRCTCDLDGDRWSPTDYCSFAERKINGRFDKQTGNTEKYRKDTTGRADDG